MPAGPDPLPQLVPNRVESALRRIRDLVWSESTAVIVTAAAATAAHRSLKEVASERRRPVRIGEAWGKLYDQRWFHLALPTAADKSPRAKIVPRYLEWRDQGEATLWIDGAPYFGFDVAHRRVALPAATREAWVEGYCCQSAIWHPDATGLSDRGSIFNGAFLATRDDAAWDAAQDFQALFDLMLHVRAQQTPTPPRELARVGQQPGLENATPIYRRLLRLLSDAIDAFDTRGVAGLRPQLAAARRELRDPRARIQATLTGHAHIDLVWLWPERMGEAKAVHTFATVNRLMERYPEFRFAYSQPASYRAVERRAPALAQAVSARVRSGQWEPTGALDVESDTLLPCGEALARSFLLGQEEFKRLRGSPARLLWLPDVFGYSGCLPQLMRLAGVDWFFTTKLTWSGVTRFPYSSFVWRGTDGSEVIAHVTQNAGYNNRLDLAELDANARGHVQADVHAEYLHPTGYGDGGGGPTEEMCERARRLNALAGTPALTWDQPEAFFARLARKRKQLPTYQGECYLEYHRGTFTTHGDLKAAFRGLERALQVREAVAVATSRTPDLTATWRRLVFAQFHDYIPGSAIAEVYAQGVPELAQLARTELAAAATELTTAAADASTAWHAFNPLPQPWSGWVNAPKSRTPQWLELPPLASRPLIKNARASTDVPAPARGTARTLTNDRVHAELDAAGWLARLVIDGEEIAFTGASACAVLYPDRPANYDAWDIDRAALALGEPVTTPPRFALENKSPDRAVIAVRRKLGRASELTLRYILESGSVVLRLEAEVDWHEPHTLLKLHFPTAYRGLNARFGAPFGSVLRSQQPGMPSVEAQWEVPGSRWAAVSHDGERSGLALITEAKYGFSARDGELTVSLLRGARITGCDDHRYAAPPGLSHHQPNSPFSDQGRHVIKLALARYESSGRETALPAALADTLFATPIVYRGPARDAGLLAVEGAPSLVPAWAVPATESAWVLRLHEVSGQPGTASLKLAPGWSARRCGLDGTPAASLPRGQLKFRPYEIVSVRLERV
jgi:alpha-mannosidase